MSPPKTEDKKEDADASVADSAVSSQYGIWEFWSVKQTRFNPQRRWLELKSGLELFRRLAREIYSISPGLLVIFISSKLWRGIETAVLMHLSSRLLQIIEAGIIEGHVNAYAIYSAITARLACLAFVATIRWWTDNSIPAVKTRIVFHYEVHLMRERLRLDLPTAQEPDSKSRISAHDAWNAFQAIVEFFAEILTSTSQFTLILHASRSSGGPLFALLCVLKPLLRTLSSQSIWSRMLLVNSNNAHYKRMMALKRLTDDEYRQDYITGNLSNHILNEYEKAQKNLGDTCTDEFWVQFERRSSPYFEILSSIVGDLPTVYCAINAIVNPNNFSIASIAVLQQSSLTLRYSLDRILHNSKSFQRHVSKLKNLYAVSEVKNRIKDGALPYPQSEEKNAKGMAFELKNVTFTYPGSKTKTSALNNISISIKPGQLVVIVGANGSGKSTIIKLLARLYDPTSGAILIDDVPVQQFRAFDLRKAMATFTQDHHLYPLSLYENIALGNPAVIGDASLIATAAEQGGASDFIAKLDEGLDTILDPMNNVFSLNVPSDPEHPLQKQKDKLQKKLDISGGERQRVVASRTFLHLNSGNVRFVAVDEPTSALDPEGEAQLFQRLIAGRGGKTMVFVTHRFGHLTKFADVIICMKDGMIVESGSHEILLGLNGEYAKLYKIQADAFSGEVNTGRP